MSPTLLTTRTPAWILAATAIMLGCGSEPPAVEPVAEPITLEAKTSEILVLLEANQKACLAQARNLIAHPVNFKNEDKAAFIEFQGRKYRPDTIKVLTVAKSRRALADKAFTEVSANFGSETDYMNRMELLRRAETNLCRTLENTSSKGAPNEDRVSRHLGEFLAEFKTLTRRFPISEVERRDVLARFQPEVHDAEQSAQDKIEASREASALVGRDPLSDQAKKSAFFEPVVIGPKPLSSAEIAAVELAAGYMEQGPRAWTAAFAVGTGWAELETNDLTAELLARLGPNSGVTWTLQKASNFAGETAAIFHIEHPSGFDEAVLLDMIEEDGAWKVRGLRTNLDRTKRFRGIPPAAGPAQAGMAGLLPKSDGPAAPTPIFLALLAAALAGAALTRVPLAHSTAVAAASLATALTLLACAREDTAIPQPPPPAAQPKIERLGALAQLKTAVSQSGPDTAAPAFEEFTGREDSLAEVAKLWQAQWRLQNFDLDGTATLLDTLDASRRPLRHLVRARLNYYRGDLEALEKAYRSAQARGLDHAGLRLEAALAYSALGLDGHSEAMLDSVGKMGSRNSLPYFALARIHALNGRVEDAVEMFLSAWQLAPLPRRQIFEDGALAWLATRPRILERLEVSSPTEPLVAPAQATSLETTLPSGFESVVSGELLEVRIGDNELLIPGGAGLAPETARVATAVEVTERTQRAALANLERFEGSPELLAVALTHPQAAGAVTMLAYSGRWDRILELTETIDSALDRMSPELVKLRAFALERRGRSDEARRLLLAQARNDRVNKRLDPEMFFQLGELLVRSGEHDLAIRLIERGNSLTTLFGRPYRAAQIRLEKNLVADDNTYSGSGFELRYPRVSGPDYPVKVTKVLTAERRRLSKWVPIKPTVPIKVDLYPFLDFMAAYGGPLSIVGLFDGRVRVPFADLHSLRPEIVSILSHELAHAMISARTNDNAPKWFQEGLAQHIEMNQPLNPIPDLRAKNRVLSLPVIEAVLGGMAEGQYVELAYSQSVWAIHYVEAAFGVSGIHRLLAEFADGATTAEAIEGALGIGLAEFDRRAWDWCANEAPAAWKVEVRRYDKELNGLLVKKDPAKPNSRPQLRRAKEPVLQPERKVSHAALALWHRRYKKEVQGVHSTLLPVLIMGTGQAAWDHGNSCSTLLREINTFRAKSTVLNTPDPNLTRSLMSLHSSTEKLAKSCVGGETASTAALAKKTMALFEAANRKLQANGLTP